MKTDDLIRKLAAEAAETPRRLELGVRLTRVAVLVFAVTMVIGLASHGIRPDLIQTFSTGAGVLKFAGCGILALGAFFLWKSMAYPAPHVMAWPLYLSVGVAALLAVVSIALAPALPSMSALISGALYCSQSIILLSVVPVVALLVVLRHGAPVFLPHAGAAAGLLGGAVGAMAFALSCPADDALFVTVVYGGTVLLLAGIGAMAGPRVLRW